MERANTQRDVTRRRGRGSLCSTGNFAGERRADVSDDATREQIALFRYGLIANLIHRPAGERGLYVLLREKAERIYSIPGSRRTRVAAETIRDWLQAYRRGGFDVLRPQPRSQLSTKPGSLKEGVRHVV